MQILEMPLRAWGEDERYVAGLGGARTPAGGEKVTQGGDAANTRL